MEKPITTWQQGTPFSEEFNDIYFNPKEGLAESHYVFFQHNNLKKRFNHTQRFVIGELGFGTGLKFFHTVQQFLALAPANAQLDFMSIEAYPLSPEIIHQAISQYPQFSSLCDTLLAQYPPATEGFHRLILCQGRVRLTLLFGIAADMLSQWVGRVDAWFLDGFSPKKNPDMWSLPLLQDIAKLSHENTTFSTFTAASSTRKNLIKVGFSVHKAQGFDRKRDMLYGQFSGPKSKPNVAPWCGLYTRGNKKNVFIIGGGLAGCATAYCLTQRGIPTTLIEAQTNIAQGASGNPIGLLRPHFSPNHDLFDQFYTAGFYGTKRIIEMLNEQYPIAQKFSGLLQLLTNQRLEQKYSQIQSKRNLSSAQLQAHTPNTLSKNLNIISQYHGILFPEAGALCPVDLCHAFTQSSELTIHTQQEVTKLVYDGSHWHITTAQGDHFTATHIVLATATQSTALPLCTNYPLTESAGQLTLIPQYPGTPDCALSYEGYLTPALKGWHALGASFRPHGANTTVDRLEQEKNLNQLAVACPNLAKQIKLNECQARVSVRAVTPDHLPLIGPIDHYADFNQRWFKFAKGYQRHTPTPQPAPNAYLISGFGAKGLASCWLSAEIIASLVDHTPLPISNTLYKALYPARFWLRAQQKSSYTPNTFANLEGK